MEAPPLLIKPPRRTWRARLARWAVMLVIFSCGSVAGYCVKTFQMTESDGPPRGMSFRPERFPDYLHAQLKKDLSLTEEQSPKVKDILVRKHQKFDELRIKVTPLFETAMAELDREMQAVLTPDQWKLYKERRHRRSPPGGPGRGGSGWSGGRRGPGHDGHSSHDGKGPPRDKRPSDGGQHGAPKDGAPVEAKPDTPKAEPAGDKAPDSK